MSGGDAVATARRSRGAASSRASRRPRPRGVPFVVCNVAVRNPSRRIVREGESAGALHQELVAGLLPGTIVVPDLFGAISHAQKRGVSSIFID